MDHIGGRVLDPKLPGDGIEVAFDHVLEPSSWSLLLLLSGLMDLVRSWVVGTHARVGASDKVAHDVRFLVWECEEREFAEVGGLEPHVLALRCSHFDATEHPAATHHRLQDTVVQVFGPVGGDRFRVDPGMDGPEVLSR